MGVTPSQVAVAGAGAQLPQLQPAGARIGVFSLLNYWAGALGDGPDFSLGRTFVIAFWRSSAANNQTIWGFNTATSGWFLIHGNARNLLLFYRGVGGGSSVLSSNLYFGLNVVAITRKLDGTVRFCLNGCSAVAVAAPGTYTAGGVLAVHAVGKNQGEVSLPATGSSVLAQAVIDAEATDAELQRWSGQANALDRWHLHPEIAAHGSLRWLANWEDWDGASATFAGTGASPYTLTRAGTGGGKTAMPAYLRYRIPRRSCFDNGYWENLGGGRIRHSVFANSRFVSSAVDVVDGPAGLIVDLYVTQVGVVANSNAGLSVNGTNLAANNVGVEPDTVGFRAIDCPGIPAGAGKAFVVTDGSQSQATPGAFTVVAAQYVRVPATTPLAWTPEPVPTHVVVNVSESLFVQVGGITDVAGVKGPPYQAWPMLERANWSASRRVVCEGWGFGTWFERIGSASSRAAFLAQMQRVADASVSNWFWLALGTNDFGLNTYSSLVTFEADLVSFLGSLSALGLPDFQAFVASPTTRTGEGTPNGSGFTLPDFRTAMSNAVTTLADPNVSYVEASAYVSAGNRPDGLHFNPAGHVEYEAAMRLVLGY